ncbi:unnamed protein product [Malus baccata var. baccata]
MENKYEGIVKAVDSGVCLVIMPIKREDQLKPRYVKRIYLSLATARIWTPESMLQQGSLDSSITWCSRELMRNLCIGKCVKFRIERTTSEGKSYGPVTIQGKDAALPAGQRSGTAYSRITNAPRPARIENRARALAFGAWFAFSISSYLVSLDVCIYLMVACCS